MTLDELIDRLDTIRAELPFGNQPLEVRISNPITNREFSIDEVSDPVGNKSGDYLLIYSSDLDRFLEPPYDSL